MEKLATLQEYFKKMQRAIENADFTFFNYKFVKRNRIDDLLVCTLAVLPDSYKNAMKKRLKVDMYPSVSCYNRLSRIIKKTFALTPDYYMVNYSEVKSLFESIRKNLELDIRKLEEQI